MEKEKTISLEKGDVESDAAIRYDYHPGGDFGTEYQEEYINVFRGNKHILVSRYFDEGDSTPKYSVTELDLEGGKERHYKSKMRSESPLYSMKAEASMLEKKALLNASEIYEAKRSGSSYTEKRSTLMNLSKDAFKLLGYIVELKTPDGELVEFRRDVVKEHTGLSYRRQVKGLDELEDSGVIKVCFFTNVREIAINYGDIIRI